MRKIKIKEDESLADVWLNDARTTKVGGMQQFLLHLVNGFQHTDQSKPEAAAAAAIAGALAFNKTKQGGMTEQQMGETMWNFITMWTGAKNLCGFRIIDFSDMLYPVNAYAFEKTITHENWTALRELAQVKIDGYHASIKEFEEKTLQYPKDLEDFKARHPDYDTRPEYYTKNITGSWDLVAADEKRARAGFEFAPVKPVMPPVDQAVIDHWISIVEGKVPFGYEILLPSDQPATDLKVVKTEDEQQQ